MHRQGLMRVRTAQVATLCLLLMASGASCQFVLGALGPHIVPDLQLSLSLFGLLATTLYAVGALASQLFGIVVDRAPLVAVVIGLGFLTCIALLSFAFATGPAMLFVGCIVGGFALAGANPVTNRILQEKVPIHAQGRLTGVKQSGVPLAAASLGLGLPLLASASNSWRVAAAAAVTLPLVASVLFRSAKPATEAGEGDSPVQATERAERVRVSSELHLARYSGLMGCTVAAMNVYLPLYGYEVLELNASRAGMLTGCVGAAGVAGRLAWGYVSDRSLTATCILQMQAAGGVISSLLLVAAPAAGGSLLWAAGFIAGFTVVASNAIVMLMVVQTGVPGAVGRLSAHVQRGFFIGLAGAPLVFGFIIDVTDSYTPVWTCVGVVSGWLVYRARKADRRTATSAP